VNVELRARVCPVRRRGVELRAECERCAGQPAAGQSRYERGELLCLEGREATHVVPIISGFARELRTLPDGRTQALRLLQPGDIAGIEALHAPTYRSTVECVTRVRACRIAGAEVGEYVVEHNAVSRPLLRVVEEQAASLADGMVWLGQGSAEERVFAFLERLLQPYPRGSWVRVPLTRGEMGELLGLGLSTVSRTVHRLAAKKVLEVRGRSLRFLDRPE